MPIADTDVPAALKDIGSRAGEEWERLRRFDAYYRGVQDTPYKPRTATAEFSVLVKKCTTNLTRLVVNTLTQRLIVDGYKASAVDVTDAAPWAWWQTNGLDARQKALYDEVGKCGYAYCNVMPGGEEPSIRPTSPLEWYAAYDSPDDDWPTLAVKKPSDGKTWVLMDDHSVRTFAPDPNYPGRYAVTDETVHGLGVVPLVIFRNEFVLTGHPVGEVEASIPIQDRLNQTVFDLLVAQTYAAAPQKWIAGLSAPTDEQGNAILDIRAFAKSVWVDPNPDARFGSLPEANLANLVRAIDNTLRMYGLMTQTPPHYLLGEMVNLSAEALVAADSTMAKKVQDRQMILGEAWEQTLRLAAHAAGDESAATDDQAQVRWRDTEPRSIAAVVDALGKLAQMLGVPVQALWDKVPGITNQDLERWRAEAARAKLQAARDAARNPPPPPPGAQPEPGANNNAMPPNAARMGIQGSQPIAS